MNSFGVMGAFSLAHDDLRFPAEPICQAAAVVVIDATAPNDCGLEEWMLFHGCASFRRADRRPHAYSPASATTATGSSSDCQTRVRPCAPSRSHPPAPP